jgi:hypothetical protein
MEVDGHVLRFTETEILTDPCFCLCCYDVRTVVADLDPGDYTVEYCWIDDELGEYCQIEAIEIP